MARIFGMGEDVPMLVAQYPQTHGALMRVACSQSVACCSALHVDIKSGDTILEPWRLAFLHIVRAGEQAS